MAGIQVLSRLPEREPMSPLQQMILPPLMQAASQFGGGLAQGMVGNPQTALWTGMGLSPEMAKAASMADPSVQKALLDRLEGAQMGQGQQQPMQQMNQGQQGNK